MSDFSLTLVLQNQDKQNHQWHGKSTNKIWENHSFWRNISRKRAFFPLNGSDYRQSAGASIFVLVVNRWQQACLSLVPRLLIARAPLAYRSCPVCLSLVTRLLIARDPSAYRSWPVCLSLVPFNFQLRVYWVEKYTHKSPPTMPDEAVSLPFFIYRYSFSCGKDTTKQKQIPATWRLHEADAHAQDNERHVYTDNKNLKR